VRGDGDAPVIDEGQYAQLETELREALEPSLQLVKELGHGGMGVVYLARDRALKRLVVVKVLAPALAHDANARRRFEREAEAAAAVTHPNVVAVHHVGELPASDTSYFVMQYVPGKALNDVFPEGTVVPEARARRIVGEISLALAAAHARGLVHRDIKPSNVMLEDESDRAIVLDFGISAAVTPERQAQQGTKLTGQGMSVGTPQYMSPEQAAGGEVTDRSDVYSLGLVAFELLAGRPPFEADTPISMVAAHLKDTPPSVRSLRPDCDERLGALVDRCLLKEPEERPSAEEVARALSAGVRPMVEWPPPGLEPLRGMLWKSVRVFEAIGALALVGYLLLSTRTVNGVRFESSGDTVALLATVMVMILFVLLLVYGVAAGDNFGRRARWARKSGYPLGVAIDVGLDGWDHTSRLLNGFGEFATLSEAARWALVRRRRVASVVTMTGQTLAALGVTGWYFGLFGPDGTRAGTLITTGTTLWLFLPVLAGISARFALLARERRMVIRAREGESVILKEPPPVPPNLVAGWLAESGIDEPAPVGRVRLRLQSEGVEGVFSVVFGLFGLVTLAALLTITIGALGASAPIDPDDWRRAVVGEEGTHTAGSSAPVWQRLDDALDVVAPLNSGTPEIDAAGYLLQVATVSPIAEEREYAVTDVLADSVARAWRNAAVPTDSGLLWTAWGFLPGVVSADVASRLEAHANAPAVRAFRTIAEGGPLPEAWYLSFASDSGVSHPTEFWGARLLAFQRAARGVSAAAHASAAAGDFESARARVREIFVVARMLARDPTWQAHRNGLGVLEVGVRSWRELGRVSRDTITLATADRLSRLLGERRQAFQAARSAHRVAIDPAVPFLLPFVADTTQARVDRWLGLVGIARGACLNRREVFGGVSETRRRSLVAATEAVADIPRSSDWLRAADEWLDVFDRPIDALLEEEERSGLSRLTAWVMQPFMGGMLRGTFAC
jgi:serine/threonine-protein kinase